MPYFRFVTLLFVLVAVTNCFAQNSNNIIDYYHLRNDLTKYEKWIKKDYFEKNSEDIGKQLKIYHVFYLYQQSRKPLDSFIEENKDSANFQASFNRNSFFKKDGKRFDATSYIVDSAGNLLALSDGKKFMMVSTFSEGFMSSCMAIVYLLNETNGLLFKVYQYPLTTLFMIDKSQLFIYEEENNKLLKYTPEDYLELKRK